MLISFGSGRKAKRVSSLLAAHFGKTGTANLSVSERQFPFRVRADLQRAVEQVFGSAGATAGVGDAVPTTPTASTTPATPARVLRFCGLRKDHAFRGIHLAELLTDGRFQSAIVAPPEYEEIDIGEDRPVRCLKVGLWLLEREGGRYAVLLSLAEQCGMPTGVRFQVAAPDDERGAEMAEGFFRAVEQAVREARSYRGKVLSLEQGPAYTGQSTGIKVHKLHTVEREQVILPARTLDLLDRNVIQFVRRRQRLSAFGLPTRKGLLFYGPPGTGKSHTIHYLAGALPGHTTLLVTAEQVGLLDEYMALARLLQPSVVVIEDVDLIARDRTQMHSAGEEALLNKLLNEMDGLRESADVLFILTTNRPEALEAALAARPGRVDQAIEFPLPDGPCREKLVRLYSKGVEVPPEVASAVVARTHGVSAAFIKELMRRSVQFHLERDEAPTIDSTDVDNALDEMLFSGGTLNVKLLGGNIAAAACGDGAAGDGADSRGAVTEIRMG